MGGLSLGAARAGFNVQCAVELDSRASTMHSINFPKSVHVITDIRTLRGEALLAKACIKSGHLTGLIGGPPCQGFSAIGLKAKADPRNNLFMDFFRIVSETNPSFFLAENVPGVLDKRNAALLQRAKEQIPKKFILLKPFTVRASDYGAATTRTRVFFYGYDPSRVAALHQTDFIPQNADDIRVRHALSCLPGIRATWQTEEQSWRSVGSLDASVFATKITDQVPIGVGCPDALARYKRKREVSGFLGTVHSESTIKRFRALGIGKVDPISKTVRLDPNGYCPTLRAGTGPERGSYQAIRPVHPTSPRVISPREAARLQGFPDWYQFHPTKWHSFREIGNSISPIVAEALLTAIWKSVT